MQDNKITVKDMQVNLTPQKQIENVISDLGQHVHLTVEGTKIAGQKSSTIEGPPTQKKKDLKVILTDAINDQKEKVDSQRFKNASEGFDEDLGLMITEKGSPHPHKLMFMSSEVAPNTAELRSIGSVAKSSGNAGFSLETSPKKNEHSHSIKRQILKIKNAEETANIESGVEIFDNDNVKSHGVQQVSFEVNKQNAVSIKDQNKLRASGRNHFASSLMAQSSGRTQIQENAVQIRLSPLHQSSQFVLNQDGKVEQSPVKNKGSMMSKRIEFSNASRVDTQNGQASQLQGSSRNVSHVEKRKTDEIIQKIAMVQTNRRRRSTVLSLDGRSNSQQINVPAHLATNLMRRLVINHAGPHQKTEQRIHIQATQNQETSIVTDYKYSTLGSVQPNVGWQTNQGEKHTFLNVKFQQNPGKDVSTRGDENSMEYNLAAPNVKGSQQIEGRPSARIKPNTADNQTFKRPRKHLISHHSKPIALELSVPQSRITPSMARSSGRNIFTSSQATAPNSSSMMTRKHLQSQANRRSKNISFQTQFNQGLEQAMERDVEDIVSKSQIDMMYDCSDKFKQSFAFLQRYDANTLRALLFNRDGSIRHDNRPLFLQRCLERRKIRLNKTQRLRSKSMNFANSNIRPTQSSYLKERVTKNEGYYREAKDKLMVYFESQIHKAYAQKLANKGRETGMTLMRQDTGPVSDNNDYSPKTPLATKLAPKMPATRPSGEIVSHAEDLELENRRSTLPRSLISPYGADTEKIDADSTVQNQAQPLVLQPKPTVMVDPVSATTNQQLAVKRMYSDDSNEMISPSIEELRSPKQLDQQNLIDISPLNIEPHKYIKINQPVEEDKPIQLELVNTLSSNQQEMANLASHLGTKGPISIEVPNSKPQTGASPSPLQPREVSLAPVVMPQVSDANEGLGQAYFERTQQPTGSVNDAFNALAKKRASTKSEKVSRASKSNRDVPGVWSDKSEEQSQLAEMLAIQRFYKVPSQSKVFEDFMGQTDDLNKEFQAINGRNAKLGSNQRGLSDQRRSSEVSLPFEKHALYPQQISSKSFMAKQLMIPMPHLSRNSQPSEKPLFTVSKSLHSNCVNYKSSQGQQITKLSQGDPYRMHRLMFETPEEASLWIDNQELFIVSEHDQASIKQQTRQKSIIQIGDANRVVYQLEIKNPVNPTYLKKQTQTKRKMDAFENLNLYSKDKDDKRTTIGDMNSSVYRISPSLMGSQMDQITPPTMIGVGTGYEDKIASRMAERKQYKIHEIITKQFERPQTQYNSMTKKAHENYTDPMSAHIKYTGVDDSPSTVNHIRSNKSGDRSALQMKTDELKVETNKRLDLQQRRYTAESESEVQGLQIARENSKESQQTTQPAGPGQSMPSVNIDPETPGLEAFKKDSRSQISSSFRAGNPVTTKNITQRSEQELSPTQQQLSHTLSGGAKNQAEAQPAKIVYQRGGIRADELRDSGVAESNLSGKIQDETNSFSPFLKVGAVQPHSGSTLKESTQHAGKINIQNTFTSPFTKHEIEIKQGGDSEVLAEVTPTHISEDNTAYLDQKSRTADRADEIAKIGASFVIQKAKFFRKPVYNHQNSKSRASRQTKVFGGTSNATSQSTQQHFIDKQITQPISPKVTTIKDKYKTESFPGFEDKSELNDSRENTELRNSMQFEALQPDSILAVECENISKEHHDPPSLGVAVQAEVTQEDEEIAEKAKLNLARKMRYPIHRMPPQYLQKQDMGVKYKFSIPAHRRTNAVLKKTTYEKKVTEPQPAFETSANMFEVSALLANSQRSSSVQVGLNNDHQDSYLSEQTRIGEVPMNIRALKQQAERIRAKNLSCEGRIGELKPLGIITKTAPSELSSRSPKFANNSAHMDPCIRVDRSADSQNDSKLISTSHGLEMKVIQDNHEQIKLIDQQIRHDDKVFQLVSTEKPSLDAWQNASLDQGKVIRSGDQSDLVQVGIQNDIDMSSRPNTMGYQRRLVIHEALKQQDLSGVPITNLNIQPAPSQGRRNQIRPKLHTRNNSRVTKLSDLVQQRKRNKSQTGTNNTKVVLSSPKGSLVPDFFQKIIIDQKVKSDVYIPDENITKQAFSLETSTKALDKDGQNTAEINSKKRLSTQKFIEDIRESKESGGNGPAAANNPIADKVTLDSSAMRELLQGQNDQGVIVKSGGVTGSRKTSQIASRKLFNLPTSEIQDLWKEHKEKQDKPQFGLKGATKLMEQKIELKPVKAAKKEDNPRSKLQVRVAH